MNPITVTVTGRLGDDPRAFNTSDGTAGVELRLAIDLSRNGSNLTRWVKVNAYGVLAARTAESVRKGDRVTVIAEDLLAEAWISENDGQPQARSRVTLRAREIAASMAFDTLRTGYADRKAARAAAANGQPNDLPASEQADAQVLAGVTGS